MEITAKLIEVFEVIQVTDAFKKREFVVEYSENAQYTEVLKFELTQDRCEAINKFEVGQNIDISFNLKGRKWTSPKGEVKYFNSLQAWKISPEGSTAEQPSSNQAPADNEDPNDSDTPF